MVAVLVLATLLVTGGACTSGGGSPAPFPQPLEPSAGTGDAFTRGIYGSAIRRTDSTGVPRIDVDATVDALVRAHADVYAYLICPDPSADPRVSRTQYADLPAFARRAETAGIKVYVYLVPPTEAPQTAYAPFFWNYRAWAQSIGRLAASLPAITGIMIDDFGGNTRPRPGVSFYFTPDYLRTMLDLARAAAPRLVLLPVLYYHDLVGPAEILSAYRSVVSGVVFPYFGTRRGHLEPGNTTDSAQALEQGRAVSELLRCPGDGCVRVAFPGTLLPPGQSEAAVLEATLRPGADGRRTVSVEAVDSSGGSATIRHRIDVLLDGQLHQSWRPGPSWSRHTFDVTPGTDGASTVVVTLRITRPSASRRSSSQVLIARVETTGFAPDPAFEARAVRGRGHVEVGQAPAAPVLFMPYAVPLSREQGRGASPAYLSDVLAGVEQLRREHRIAGSLVFNPPLPDPLTGTSSPNYDIVVEAYERMSRSR